MAGRSDVVCADATVEPMAMTANTMSNEARLLRFIKNVLHGLGGGLKCPVCNQIRFEEFQSDSASKFYC